MQIMDIDEDASSICESTVSICGNFHGGEHKVMKFERVIENVNITKQLCFGAPQASLTEGCRLPVRMNGTNDWPLAEIISVKDIMGQQQKLFYVHYVDCKWESRVILFCKHFC